MEASAVWGFTLLAARPCPEVKTTEVKFAARCQQLPHGPPRRYRLVSCRLDSTLTLTLSIILGGGLNRDHLPGAAWARLCQKLGRSLGRPGSRCARTGGPVLEIVPPAMLLLRGDAIAVQINPLKLVGRLVAFPVLKLVAPTCRD